MSASSANTLLKIKWNTINLTDKHFRELIVQQSFEENFRDLGVFELDERYCGECEGREVVEQQARLWYLACYMLYGAWKRKRKECELRYSNTGENLLSLLTHLVK
jgi:hypothetical protein